MKKIYFKNLNGLRFIAALSVIIHHTEQLKSKFGLESKWGLNIINNLGNIGVQFFFVLSGFLITYLLLDEKKRGEINYKKFIFRRIYRIWPLYFTIIILSFFIAPRFEILNTPFTATIFDDFYLKLICVCLFIPNIIFKIVKAVPLASQSWSIGVEEQFYIFWPLIVKKVKKPLTTFTLIILTYVLVKIFFFRISIIYMDLNVISKIINDFSLSGFVLGAIGAYIAYDKKQKLLYYIVSKIIFRFSVFIFILLMINLNSESYYYFGIISIENEIFCFLFIIFIINFIYNKKLTLSLENNAFTYLGKISYGLYMYHPICITLLLNLMKTNNSLDTLIYPLTLIFTIFLASLSYKYIEKPFLKLKKY